MKWATAASRSEETDAALAEAGAVVEAGLDAAPDWLLAFASPHHATARLADALADRFPDATLLACTAGGTIGGGAEIEAGPGLALAGAHLPGVALRPFALAGDELATGALAERAGADAEVLVLLADPFSAPGEALVEAASRELPGSVVVGGLASGGAGPGSHGLVAGPHRRGDGAVGVALSGDVAARTVVAQGCRPIGQPLFVTRCRENLLLEVDGRAPAAVLEELFEAADARERALLQSSLFLGIQMRPEQVELQRGDFLVRNLVGLDRESGALAVSALLEEAMVVQFQLRDAHTAAEDLALRLGALSAAGDARARGALLFSCLGRGRGMYGVADHDSDCFRRYVYRDAPGDVPLTGFFGNGEIGPVEGRSFVHAYTSAFAIFEPRAADSG